MRHTTRCRAWLWQPPRRTCCCLNQGLLHTHARQMKQELDTPRCCFMCLSRCCFMCLDTLHCCFMCLISCTSLLFHAPRCCFICLDTPRCCFMCLFSCASLVAVSCASFHVPHCCFMCLIAVSCASLLFHVPRCCFMCLSPVPRSCLLRLSHQSRPPLSSASLLYYLCRSCLICLTPFVYARCQALVSLSLCHSSCSFFLCYALSFCAMLLCHALQLTHAHIYDRWCTSCWCDSSYPNTPHFCPTRTIRFLCHSVQSRSQPSLCTTTLPLLWSDCLPPPLVMHHNPAFAVVCLSPSISPPPLVMHHNPALAVGFLFPSPCVSSPIS